MKRTLYLCAAAALSLFVAVSCAKTQISTTPSEGEGEETLEPQVVKFSTNLKNNGIATKAGVDAWANDSLYIFGINLKEPDFLNPFINNTLTITNNPGSISATEDALVVVKDKHEIEGILKDEPYYYGTNPDDRYDFYAYHLGYDTTGTNFAPAITAQSIKADVVLKGWNDVMLAATDKEEDAILANGTMVNPKYLYSEYSARKGVVPNLVFEHQLSRFQFQFKVGGTAVPDSIRIDSVSLRSLESGVLTVATTEDGASTGLVMNGDETTDKVWLPLTVTTDGVPAVQPFSGLTNDYQTMGESIMIAPCDSCTMRIKMTQKFEWGHKDADYIDVILPENVSNLQGGHEQPTSFEAGKKYIVQVVIYGLEEVKIR